MKFINTAVGILSARLARRPFYVRFHITHRCNYRCRMCGLHQREDRGEELSAPQVHAVARRLAELGARHVVITGGEPFMCPDLPEARRPNQIAGLLFYEVTRVTSMLRYWMIKAQFRDQRI